MTIVELQSDSESRYWVATAAVFKFYDDETSSSFLPSSKLVGDGGATRAKIVPYTQSILRGAHNFCPASATSVRPSRSSGENPRSQ